MVIKERIDPETGKHEYGMSSAKGDSKNDLPTVGVPQGSQAIDYTTLTPYFWDGVSWN